MRKRLNVILCGYHWTGCSALEQLLDCGYNVYVYTHETQNEVSDLVGMCLKRNIQYTTEKICKSNMPFVPDVICSIYYRYLIDLDVIESVKGKIFNLHPSLLPQYRGCSSITWAMINGEKETGFTYHYIDKGCDTGNIILQEKVKIENYDTQLTLYNRVMFLAMERFKVAFDSVLMGVVGYEQTGESSFYYRGCPFDGQINEDMNAEMKERFIRAMIYPPYPCATYNGEYVRTYKELLEKKSD